MIRAIKAFERIKRATIYQNVEQNEFNQARREQKFVRIMHRDQTKVESHNNFVILDKHFLNLM
jgi:hypothetical protein